MKVAGMVHVNVVFSHLSFFPIFFNLIFSTSSIGNPLMVNVKFQFLENSQQIFKQA